jgi:hypothetical protein
VKRIISVIGGVLILGLLVSCGGYNVPADMVAIQEGRGAESKKVKGCQEPGTRSLAGNDEYYFYPISEREWDATGQDGSDSGRFTAITADNVQMYVPVTVRFTLKTDCETLTDFYTSFARRYKAHFEDDGTYTDGWVTLLRKLVKDPADAQLDRIVQGYKWRDVWKDPTTKVEIEKALDENLTGEASLMTQVTNGKSYFDGISVIVGQPEPMDENLATAVAEEASNVARAQSAEAQAAADVQKARAEVAVARAEAAKRRAEITGYGSKEVFICLKLAEAGLNCKQPQYIVGGSQR